MREVGAFAGDAYVTGHTNSTRFPTTPGAFQTARGGDPLERFIDGFVLKLNSTGSSLIYSSYLGGKFDDVARAVAVDSAGNAYITGSTQSPDFPAANASQGGLSRAFVTKVNPAGSALLYSTRIGGSGDETASAIAVDAAGSAYVTGSTTSSDFPAVNAYQQTFSGKSAFKSNTGGGSWGAINNDLPPGDGVRSLAVDPHNTSTIYAGTDSRGIFKSTTGGASWAAINSGIADLASIGFPNLFDRVTDLAIDPANPNIIYAAMFGPALYKSTNGGGSWSLLDTRLVNAIAIDPTNSSIVYTVDSAYGLSTSTDGGISWDIGGGGVNPAFNCRAVAVAPTNPPSIYIGSSGRGAFRVGGGFFFPAAVQVISLAVDPATPSTVYAGTFVSGVYKTTNGGNAWSPASARMSAANTPAVTVFSLAVDPANPSTIYAGTSVGVFKSTDGGGNWGPINAGLPNRVVNEIAVDPSNTSTLYAGAAATSDVFAAELSPSGSAIVFSTYFGGASVENGSGIAVDASGDVYVTGATTSTRLAANPLRPFSGGSDAFVVKFNPAIGALVYLTYVGGSNNDQSNGIAVDASGAAYVVGTTFSADYPTTPGALSIPPLGACPNATCTHVFLTKLNSAGSALLYSTYLGGVTGEPNSNGIGKDNGNAIAVDSNGGVYVTGLTTASDFPITPGAFDATYNGSVDAFVSKISITPFDACIQDDRNGNLLQFNLTTGDYQFSNCRKNFILTGRGAVRIRSCKIEFRASAPDRSISALANSCTLKGDATIEVFSQGQTYTIADANTSNNTCACSR